MSNVEVHIINFFRKESYQLYYDISERSKLDITYTQDIVVCKILGLSSLMEQQLNFFDYEHAYSDMEVEELLLHWHEYTEKAIKDNDFIFFIRLVYYVLGLLPECDKYIEEVLRND